MKLWDKGYTAENLVEQFTVGNDRVLDLKLAKHDITGNIAHAKMLRKIGILTEEELNAIVAALEELGIEIEAGNFEIEAGFEDVHSKIEYELVQRIGEAGKKIHTARSRNDQVLVDLHLFLREELERIKTLAFQLFQTLQELSEKHKNVPLPGYTHLQIAMPSSFGLWFGAYAETLIDDVILLNAAYKISNQNPLGSAAGYGSSFPIDRELTTGLLGFETLKYNSIAAQMSRGKLEKSVAFALSSLAGTLSKFATDVCLYMSQNFQFVSFPKELTTGSSIMPHKKNPDVFELLRAKSNRIQNMPNEIILLTNNLTSGYHRDFQLLKDILFGSIDTMKDNLTVCNFMLQHIEVNESILENNLYDHIFTVDSLNERVMNGKSFREAYRELGKELEDGIYVPNKDVKHTHVGSIGNLGTTEIKEKMNRFLKDI
ncbi:Argininosuccinate lyase [compost metagenome]